MKTNYRTSAILLAFLFATILPIATAQEESEATKSTASELVELMLSENQIVGLIDRGVELGMKLPVAENMSDRDKEEMATAIEAIKANFLPIMPWEKIHQALAAEYTEQFTEAELTEILAFYKSDTGKKLLKKQPDLLAGFAESAIGLMEESQAAIFAAKNLTRLEMSLGPKEREAVRKAKSEEPFPYDLFLGKWFGIDESDDYTSYWWHVKNADGSTSLAGLELDHIEKTYYKWEDTSRLFFFGRRGI